jgi:hypothetical protein
LNGPPIAASQTNAYCFTALVLFFISERLVGEKDAHEKFDNRYRREYREMITSSYAEETFHDKNSKRELSQYTITHAFHLGKRSVLRK